MNNIKSKLSGNALAIILVLFFTTASVSYAYPSKVRDFRFTQYSRSTGELFWERSTGIPLVIGYELTRNGESLGVMDALSYLDRNLESGKSYLYTINAIEPDGTRSDPVMLLVNVPRSDAERIEDLEQQIDDLQTDENGSTGSIPAPVAATGQTELNRFGDDGDFQPGVAWGSDRFQNNNDGTFTDTLTDITWLGVRECIVKRDWINAIEYANAMADDGVSCPGLQDASAAGDWRLPTIKELLSLMDYSRDTPAFAEGMPYEGQWTQNPWTSYWSSTSFNLAPLLRGWTVLPEDGSSSLRFKSNTYYSWPIKR